MRLTRLLRRGLVALFGDDYRPFVDAKPSWTRAPRWLVRDPGCLGADGHPSLGVYHSDNAGHPSPSALVRPLTAAGEPLAWLEVLP